MSLYTIAEQPELSSEELRAVYAGVAAGDPAAAGPRDFAPLAFTLRDAGGALVGALAGATIWGWLHVDTLWVAPALRGAGYGARLLAASEAAAQARGCTQARLDTFAFQARGFYERQGWVVYAELPGFPAGHTQYHMRKTLAPADAPAS